MYLLLGSLLWCHEANSDPSKLRKKFLLPTLKYNAFLRIDDLAPFWLTPHVFPR